jgi:trans-aconitate 2-methyltransferase
MKTELLFRTASQAPANHKAQESRDLVRRIGEGPAGRIGVHPTGPGSLEELLHERYPDAEITPLGPSSLRSGSRPSAHRDFDLIVSSGDVEILPSLRQALPRLAALARPGGRLAVQAPNNLYEPYRVLIRMVAADGPWAGTLLPIAKTRPFNESMEDLYAVLDPICDDIEIWETTYLCAMKGIETIVELMKATSLGPFLDPLDSGARKRFLRRYAAELTEAYPLQPHGAALVRFPRIFILARLRGGD